MKIYSYDKYYPIVYPSNLNVQVELHNKKLELLNVEREIKRNIARVTKALHQFEYELYLKKNKELIVERQINDPILDIYV